MDVEKIITGTLVFCLFIIMGVLVFTDFQNTYVEKGIAVDLDIEEYTLIEDTAYKGFGEINQTINKSESNLFGTQSDTTDSQNRLWGSTFSTLQLLRTIPKILQNTFTTISNALNIPPLFVSVLFLILTIGFIFAIIYVLFGIWKG